MSTESSTCGSATKQSQIMKLLRPTILTLATAGLLASSALAADNPFLGRWALTIPGGGAGWLNVNKQDGYYTAEMLWGGGSVFSLDAVCFDKDALYLTRVREVKRKVGPPQHVAEAIVAHIEGDTLKLVQMNPHNDGEAISRDEFTGKRIPDVPPAPDLSKVKFGEPISLFNGKDLTGWKLTDPGAKNGWSVQDGLLTNDPKQQPGHHENYGNLRTEKEFEDFNLKVEVNVGKDCNSGIYLRGIYEIQVADTYGRPLDSHNMGGLYSRITPSVAAENPPGEWQTFDITLVDRHLTVILNGKKIIDNQPVLGCTGGALWSDEFRPGPIYLQGDHTGIKYRSVVLKPVVK
jgi:hypothetical protein